MMLDKLKSSLRVVGSALVAYLLSGILATVITFIILSISLEYHNSDKNAVALTSAFSVASALFLLPVLTIAEWINYSVATKLDRFSLIVSILPSVIITALFSVFLFFSNNQLRDYTLFMWTMLANLIATWGVFGGSCFWLLVAKKAQKATQVSPSSGFQPLSRGRS